MEFQRVFDLLPYQLAHFPKADSLACKVHGEWVKHSTEEYIHIANELSLGFLEAGIKKDDKVAIVSSNRPEWNFTDMGLQQIGAISVPIYPNLTAEDYKFIFEDSEVKMIFCGNADLFEKAKLATQGSTHVQAIFTYDEVPGARHWREMLKDGDVSVLEQHKAQINSEDLLTLIYTSGTTGTPKGVMLTHHNLISNVIACVPIFPIASGARSLSFLPLCHVYERMVNYVYLCLGVSVYYAESMDTISDNLKEVHPDIFVTVPRLLEKVYDKIVAKGSELTGIKKALFFWALDLGLKYEQDTDMGTWYNAQLWLANKLIFNKWREALGGEVKAIVTGGAALQTRLAKVFSAAHIPILPGYGLTETSPVIAVNHITKGNRKFGTVGPVIGGIEVKIAEDGEILSRGPHIMKGYYKRPDLTAEAIDEEGWFHTGDIGEIEDGKFLKITDRKKEIFKTSGGKYIAPGAMENRFKESRFIEQVMIVGDGRKFPAAIIIPAFKFVKDWCAIKGIPFTTCEEMVTKKEVVERIQEEVDNINENYAQYEKIKKFVLLPREWTIQDGEITPTLKLKRKVILARSEALIEKLYSDN